MMNYNEIMKWTLMDKNNKGFSEKEIITINKIISNLINDFIIYEEDDEYDKSEIINYLMEKLNYIKYEINK